MRKIIAIISLVMSVNVFANTIYNSDGSFSQVVPDGRGGATIYNSDNTFSQQSGNMPQFMGR